MFTVAPHADHLVRWITPNGIRSSFSLPAAPAAPDPSETMSTETPPPLPPEHLARFCMAARDLARAREVDLLAISRPRLAREYERLVAALDDALLLVRDVATSDDPDSQGL